MSGFPVAGEGYWAEVEVEEQHLRLFSEVYQMGHVAVVYDMKIKREISRRDVDSLEDGMKRAEESAAYYLKCQHGIPQLPTVNWQMNPQMHSRQ